MSTAFHARRVRHEREVLDVLVHHEPRSTQAVGEILDRGLRATSCRAWIVERGREDPAAVVVVVRATFDRWYATVLLLDPGAAAAAAAIVDRSPAWSVNGAAPDIAPLVPLLARRRFVDVRPWIVTTYPNAVTETAGDTTRIATHADLDALVELYSGFEFAGGLTRWQLRAMLRHVLDHHYIVVIDDPQGGSHPCGALAVTTRALRYGVLDLLTVVPDQRGTRRSWALIARVQAMGNALGLAGVAALAGSNPLQLDEHLGGDHYVAVELAPPRRFLGQGRLRALYARIQPLRTRPPQWFRAPGDHPPDASVGHPNANKERPAPLPDA